MDIVQENIDNLNATLSIKIAPADYEAPVKKFYWIIRKKQTCLDLDLVKFLLE